MRRILTRLPTWMSMGFGDFGTQNSQSGEPVEFPPELETYSVVVTINCQSVNQLSG
jgi:hypothetical protein